MLAVSGVPLEDRWYNTEILWGELLLLPFDQEFIDPRSGLQNIWLCDGRSLGITQNTALFRLLGTRFGGDARRTFQIPDLRGVPVANYNYYICREGRFPERD